MPLFYSAQVKGRGGPLFIKRTRIGQVKMINAIFGFNIYLCVIQ